MSNPESVIWEIASPESLQRRRRRWRRMTGVMWSGVAFLLVFAPILLAVFLPGQGPIPGDPLRYYAGVSLPVAVLLGGWWFFYRRESLAVNRVAVAEDGLYPPFKPKERLSKSDWFVEYKDIVSIRSAHGSEVPGTGASAFEVSLKDGLKFQINTLDLLAYAGEREVRRYVAVLRGIEKQLEDPRNKDLAARGMKVSIPPHLVETR